VNKKRHSYPQVVFFLALGASSTLVLTGCGKEQTKAASSSTKSAPEKSAATKPDKTTLAEQSTNAKLNAYTGAYNSLIGSGGLP
jgi:hypothetical protein